MQDHNISASFPHIIFSRYLNISKYTDYIIKRY